MSEQVKAIQTDGGTEFEPFKSFFRKKRILHRVTSPYTLEQNGLVERKDRHIVKTGLTLLAQASLPIKFLPDAFATNVYLINIPQTRYCKENSQWKCHIV